MFSLSYLHTCNFVIRGIIISNSNNSAFVRLISKPTQSRNRVSRDTRAESNEIIRANSFAIWKVPFPRRFPIIRYLTRVPLSRSYVTHRRASVELFLKRFMNYVDRSAVWEGFLYTLVSRSPGERFWTVGRTLFTGYGFDGWICSVRKGGWHSIHFIKSA